MQILFFFFFAFAAPPTFIERLPPYTGAMAEADNFTLQCQVECSPICNLYWLKDGTPLAEDERYAIETFQLPGDAAKNDFESVVSSLRLNIAAWPNGGRLDRVIDNANYTCQSSGNLVGPDGVASTTYFRVECKCR